MNQVISDQVSFGSHCQYEPQAISAQIAPVMIPRVSSGKPKVRLR